MTTPACKTYTKIGIRCKICHHVHCVEVDAADALDWYRSKKPAATAFRYLSPADITLLTHKICGGCHASTMQQS